MVWKSWMVNDVDVWGWKMFLSEIRVLLWW
jgi:hypothetical protein